MVPRWGMVGVGLAASSRGFFFSPWEAFHLEAKILLVCITAYGLNFRRLVVLPLVLPPSSGLPPLPDLLLLALLVLGSLLSLVLTAACPPYLCRLGWVGLWLLLDPSVPSAALVVAAPRVVSSCTWDFLSAAVVLSILFALYSRLLRHCGCACSFHSSLSSIASTLSPGQIACCALA